MSDRNAASVTKREPLLATQLRSSLSHLYSHSQQASPINNDGSHSYLIEFQSRCTRRKINSLYQRKRDTKKGKHNTNAATAVDAPNNNDDDVKLTIQNDSSFHGSTFYALLSLLMQLDITQQHDAERLFSAQTLLHRIRRMKLSEAIDWEMEYPYHHENHDLSTHGLFKYLGQISSANNNSDDNSTSSSSSSAAVTEEVAMFGFQWWNQYIKFHCKQISSFHPSILGLILHKYFQERWSTPASSSNYGYHQQGMGIDLEERIKGEITLLIIAAVAYCNVLSVSVANNTTSTSTTTHMNNQVVPFLSTLSSGMAVIALRLKYTPSTISTTQSDGAGFTMNIPIVSMILNAFDSVAEIASTLPLQQLIGSSGAGGSPNIPNPQMANIQRQCLNKCICIALSSLPDSLLGSAGGARGKLSIDPRCIQAANVELRTPETGVTLLKDALSNILQHQQQEGGSDNNEEAQQQFLITCERWAKFVPLPVDFVEQTVLYSAQQQTSDNPTRMEGPFCAYLVSIFDAACASVDQILSVAAGLLGEQSNANHQVGRKRQSSRSKRRHKEKLQSLITGGEDSSSIAGQNNAQSKVEEAERERDHRGLVAYRAAMIAWDVLFQLLKKTLEVMDASDQIVEGEGPVGCVCALAAACLPYIIKNQHEIPAEEMSSTIGFISKVMEALQYICANNNASTRALTFEHIPTIFNTLAEKTRDHTQALTELEVCITQSLCQCTLVLMSKCAYPIGYFSDLTLDNDEELEIERNDVRDVLRAITTLDGQPSLAALLLLDHIIKHCEEMLRSSFEAKELPHESVVHALSSPAKSLHSLAKMVATTPGVDHQMIEMMIKKSLQCVDFTCQSIIDKFDCNTPINEVFPVSRLFCINLASFAPFFAELLTKADHLNPEIMEILQSVLGRSIRFIIECVTKIPELMASSTLDDTVYDIRGAMRSPGGEDHVSCIALMRIVVESDALALATIKSAAHINEVESAVIFNKFYEVMELLHNAEMERSPGVHHGSGVVPKSRRVLSTSICRAGIIAIENGLEGSDQINDVLLKLFKKPIENVLVSHSRTDFTKAQLTYIACEGALDLASFPPKFCSQLFHSEHPNFDQNIAQAVRILVEKGSTGYTEFIHINDPTDDIIQWGRMRGALVSLFRSCADPGYSGPAVQALNSLICLECDSIMEHCSSSGKAGSSIFHPLVISEDVVPTGAFLIAVCDVLDGIMKRTDLQNDTKIAAVSSCLNIILPCCEKVLTVLDFQCNDGFNTSEDPRSTLGEAWFLVLKGLLSAQKNGFLHESASQHLKRIVCQSIILIMELIFNTRVESDQPIEKRSSGRMCLDGPQSLAMVEFMEFAMEYSDAEVFTALAQHFDSKMNLDYPSEVELNPSLVGVGLITAALLRGASGALPPWCIEYTPNVFKALCSTCGVESFIPCLHIGCEVKLQACQDASTSSTITSGKKLAGYYLDIIKPNIQKDFVQKSKELCMKANKDKWRNFKVLLKSICGGKKRAAGFSLKPQLTTWECDRV